MGLPDGERSSHPTVKPVEVMRWLIRLVTPPGGTLWTRSRARELRGSPRILRGFKFLGIEREPEYAAIAGPYRVVAGEHGCGRSDGRGAEGRS